MKQDTEQDTRSSSTIRIATSGENQIRNSGVVSVQTFEQLNEKKNAFEVREFKKQKERRSSTCFPTVLEGKQEAGPLNLEQR